MLIIMYNTLMRSYKISLTGIVLGALMPLQALAYFTPEDVLLSKEFFLPPTSRETGDRIERQVTQSAERRTREQDVIFSEQRIAELREFEDADLLGGVLDEDETLRAAVPGQIQVLGGGLDASDLELLKAVRLLERRETRLLDRVDSNQNTLQYYGARPEFLHGGVPPLAPTGAGGVLAAITMIGAVGWTLRRAHLAGRAARTSV